ncbi:hypothetical protein ACHAWF_012073 [Thalassiosira exigua]
MVDYSKWDRMDFGSSNSSDDDSDCSDGGGGGAGPRVTSLARPGKVTIGPSGTVNVAESSSPSPSRTQSLASSSSSRRRAGEKRHRAGVVPSVSGGEGGDVADVSPGDGPRPGGPSKGSRGKVGERRSRLTRNGGRHAVPIVVDGKERKLPTYWSQDRRSVVLRLGFPPATFPTRGIRVRVVGALPYEERECAVGGGSTSGEAGGEASFGSVEVVSVLNETKEETALLRRNLPRPIHLDRDEEEVDWEIEDRLGAGDGDDDCEGDELECTKLVTITMSKAVPMAGVVLWWDRPLKGYPAIDVSTIQERQGKSRVKKGEGQQGGDEKEDAFRRAWEEAHATFREKVKSREKTSVEVDD